MEDLPPTEIAQLLPGSCRSSGAPSQLTWAPQLTSTFPRNHLAPKEAAQFLPASVEVVGGLLHAI